MNAPQTEHWSCRPDMVSVPPVWNADGAHLFLSPCPAAPFFDEEDAALAAMEFARPRKISKSMSASQLAGMEAQQQGAAGRPPREQPILAACRAALHALRCTRLSVWKAGQACSASPVPQHLTVCRLSAFVPCAVPPPNGSADKLGPLGKPIRRTNTFRCALLSACCVPVLACSLRAGCCLLPGQVLVVRRFGAQMRPPVCPAR